MKTRKAILVLLTVCCLTAFFSIAANAALDWYKCTVDQVGPYGIIEGTSGAQIYLTHDDPDPAWDGSKKFYISPSRGKDYLQTGIAALVANPAKEVKVYADPDLANPLVRGLLIQK